MSESIILELVKSIVQTFGPQIFNGIMPTGDLESQMERLEDVKSAIEATLLDANSAQVCSHSQRHVLEKLERGLAKLIDFQEKKETRAKRAALMDGNIITKKAQLLLSAPSRIISDIRDAREMKYIRKELSVIMRNHAQIGTIVGSLSGNQTQMLSLQTGSHPATDLVIGRDGDRDNIIHTLLDTSRVSVASIVGIGGVGKTTLAQYVYNDQRTKSCFDIQLWVSGSQDFDLKEVLQKIVASATDEKPIDCEMDQLQGRLRQAIAGKKFLLVLDSLWDQGDLRTKWLALRSLLQVGGQGSKVLVTTRSETVARIMDVCDPYKLGELPENDCWLLFQHIAFTQWHEPGVEAIGRKISQMCPKVPLVVRVIGSLLAQKYTVQEWRSFREDQLQNFTSYGRGVMDILKLSYDQLNWRLKLCVTYCSLFPRQHCFHKWRLMHLWIAQGYVEQQYANQSLEDAAEEYVLLLLNRGFFNNVLKDDTGRISSFRMPNLMHELVVWVGGFKYTMADSTTIGFDKRVHHVSYDDKSESSSSWKVPKSLFKINQPRSLIIPLRKVGKCVKIRVNIFSIQKICISRFQSLRTLRLHGLGIQELPECLGKLDLLRYLDLSHNPLRMLPKSITKLVNLYLLDLSHCESLEELPEGIGKLVQLRHLSLSSCRKLNHMPKELSKLTEIETLDHFIVGRQKGTRNGFKADFCGLAELDCFNNLRHRLTIYVASPSKHLVLRATTGSMERKEKITHLTVGFKYGAKEDELVLDCLQPNTDLTQLDIENYGGERLPTWMRNQLHSLLPNLISVTLRHCEGCKYLCSFGRLPHLTYLNLEGLESTEYIEDSGRGNYNGDIIGSEQPCTPLFPSLEELSLDSMPKLKGWWRVADTRQVPQNQIENQLQNRRQAFPKLKKVEMQMELVISMARGFLQGISSLQQLRILNEAGGYIPAPPTSSPGQQPLVQLNCYLPSLPKLEFLHNDRLKALPEEFLDMSSLKILTFIACTALEAIPEWIDSFASLTTLHIIRCPELKSLPHGISNLSNLKTLILEDCSKELAEKCQEPGGQDWPKIQHIHNIYIEPFGHY